MKTKIDHALSLAAEGFHVFPLLEGSKLPAIDGYPTKATRDPEQIKRWWVDPVLGLSIDRNIGISTTHYGDCDALLVIDIDNKGDMHGDEEIKKLAAQGLVLPKTRATITPTGGKHFFYRVPVAVRQGANVLAPGVDTRSYGGFVVGPGSTLSNGEYLAAGAKGLCDAPQWVIDRCGLRSKEAAHNSSRPEPGAVDPERALLRAKEYLAAAPAVSMGGRNEAGYRVAGRLKDFGVREDECLSIMAEHWKCEPMLEASELGQVIQSVFRYGQNAPGIAAPEAQFPLVSEDKTDTELHPFHKLNQEYAFTIAGGGYHILWETKDEHGNPKLEHLSPGAFHAKHAAWQMVVNKRTQPITELWIAHKDRRSYDGICFLPGQPAPERFYNLWKGFSVDPIGVHETIPKEWTAALNGFLEHARVNVCGGNEDLFRWLIGYFAHMVQRPADKPLVALVFRGGKGVGKNFLVERVGYLLGNHFLLTSNRRYLVGNFNGHLENCLLFVLDEAFWSGDKQAEGTMKDMITGKSHVIEHKGKEAYVVDNRIRVVIIGNESWLIPASHDERRFAVFDVGEGRKQDRAFFQGIREQMERGAYRLLLRYLLDFDLKGLDFNDAPNTAALLDQKHQSLEPLEQWWFECLSEGRLVRSDFDEGWPAEVETERFRIAVKRYITDRNIRSRVPDASVFGRTLAKCAPGIARHRSRVAGELRYTYTIPALEQARAEWEAYIGHKVEWD